MAKDKPTAETVNVKDLKFDHQNANRGTERGAFMLENSIREHGFLEAGTLDKNNVLIGGNKRTVAAVEAGLDEDAIVLDVDGTRPVYLRRNDIDINSTEGRRAAYALNRVAQVSIDFSPDQMLADINAGLDISDMFFQDEIDGLIADLSDHGDPQEAPEAEVDKAEELRQKWGVEYGQLWQVGRHRVLCGDSTNREDVERLLDGARPKLMVTDPPYGVEYDPTWRASAGVNNNDGKMGKVQNDDRIDWADAWMLFPGDVVYCWHAGRHASEVQRSLINSGFEIRSQIIWAKDRMVLSRGHYHWQHEPCWYAFRSGKAADFIGDRSQTTLWSIPARDDDGHGHGTQKPLECMERPIRNHEGDVYEPFAGSGTTIVAAERQNRTCYAMEIDPGYVGVILERLSLMGLTPELEQ